MTPGLRIAQLSYTRNRQVLFDGLDLALNPGEGLLIYGPNGSGKTSLLRVLAGLIQPTQGNIYWNNHCINQYPVLYHEALHYLGHSSGIKKHLTVQENIAYNQSLNNQENYPQLEVALAAVQLDKLATKLAQQLSEGQKRRLALARLFAITKPLWILDEPFANLDAEGQFWFHKKLEDHLAYGGISIITSHQPLQVKHLKILSLTGAADE